MIGQGINDQSLIALLIIKKSLLNSEKDIFLKSMAAVHSIPVYRKSTPKGSVLLVALGYLYYLVLCEDAFVVKYGLESRKKLSTFIKEIVIENEVENMCLHINQILSNSKLVLEDISRSIDLMQSSVLNFEVISTQGKWMHLDSDFLNFIVFTSVLFYNIGSPKLNNVRLNDLLGMKSRIDNLGGVVEKYQPPFYSFCSWLDGQYDHSKKNPKLNAALTSKIKEKILKEEKRRNRERTNNPEFLAVYSRLVQEKLKASSIYCESSDGYTTKEFTFSRIYSNHEIYQVADFDGMADYVKNWIEYSVFKISSDALFSHKLNINYADSSQAYKAFLRIFQKHKKDGLIVDYSFNSDFFSNTDYSEYSLNQKEHLNELQALINKRGEWNCGEDISVYIDSSLSRFGFSFNTDALLVITNSLSDTELENYAKNYSTPTGYIYDANFPDVYLEYSKEEIIEMLRYSLFKITTNCECILPKTKIGFFTKNRVIG